MSRKRFKTGRSLGRPVCVRPYLLTMIDRLTANVRAAASLFTTEDERAARLLAAEREAFRNLEVSATTSHFERLRSGRVDTAEATSLYPDALRHLKQINTHLVPAAAYPVLESNYWSRVFCFAY
jgi:phosphate:Na+ symporter